MVMKGLPTNYKTFCVVMQQREQAQTFIEFKAALRSFEENERAANQHTGGGNSSKVMYHNNNNHNGGRGGGRQSDGKKPTCFTCKKEGHKFYDCPEKQSGQHSGQQNNGQRNRNTNTNRKWCSLCKNNSHTDKTCRKQNNNSERAKQVTFGEDVHVGHLRTMASDEHSFGFNFMCNVIDDSSTTTTDAAVCDDSEVSDHSFDFDYPRHAEDSDSIADGCKDVSHSLSQTDVAVHDHSFDFDYPRRMQKILIQVLMDAKKSQFLQPILLLKKKIQLLMSALYLKPMLLSKKLMLPMLLGLTILTLLLQMLHVLHC